MQGSEMTGEILDINRLNNSVNGNPRYEIRVLPDGEPLGYSRILRTSSDISSAYEVGNLGRRVGDRVRFVLTAAGLIRALTDPKVNA